MTDSYEAFDEGLAQLNESATGLDAYVKFLSEGGEISFRHRITGDVDWAILTRDSSPTGLWHLTSIGGERYLQWELGKGFSKLLSEVGVTEFNGEQGLTVVGLRDAICVAKHEGDYLFLVSDGSIWAFFHDGHAVRRLSESWEHLIREAIFRECVPVVQSDSTGLVGEWVPISSRTETALFQYVCPIMKFSQEGRLTEIFNDGSVVESSWSTSRDRVVLDRSEGRVEYTYKLSGDELDWSLTVQSFHCLLGRKEVSVR